MRWLLQQGGPIDRFSQAMLLQVPAGLQQQHLAGALQAVLDHHDALRLRLSSSQPDDEVVLEIAPPGTIVATACLRRIDVRGLEAQALAAAIGREAQVAEMRLAPRA